MRVSTDSASLPVDENTAPTRRPDRLARWRHWARPAITANLIGQIVIVLSGGLVRLTGSGLGCSTWPQCEPGYFTPQFHEAISIHPYIEFGNRLVSIVLVIIAVVVALLVWTARHRTLQLRLWGLVPLFGVVVQAVVGGITVLIDLHPAIVGGHLLLSMALIALSAYLLVRWNEGDGAAIFVVSGAGKLWTRLVGILVIPVLVLGVIVTGTGPHSGDTTVGYRFGFDPVFITRLHSLSVWLFLIALVVAAVVLLRNTPVPNNIRYAIATMFTLTILQGIVGYVQYFNDLPIALVTIHMVLAGALAAATTWFVLTVRVRPALSAQH